MTKRMLIDATHAEETRVVVLDGSRLEDFDVETSTKRQLKGNIYLAKVVRVEPSLQAAFVEYGGNRHGFLAFGEIHPDYYQIPVADRQRLLAMEAEDARREEEEEDRAALSSDAGPAADEDAGNGPSAEADAVSTEPGSPAESEAGVHTESGERADSRGHAEQDGHTDAGLYAASAAQDEPSRHPEAGEHPEQSVHADAGIHIEPRIHTEAGVHGAAGMDAEPDRRAQPEAESVGLGEADSVESAFASPEPVASDLVAPAGASLRSQPARIDTQSVGGALDTSDDEDDAPERLIDAAVLRVPAAAAMLDIVEPGLTPEPMATGPSVSSDQVEAATGNHIQADSGPSDSRDDARHGNDHNIGHDDEQDAERDDDEPPEFAPPETVGGDTDNVEDARERRIPPRFLRNYKIQEVIRRRQILLVQVVKEERGTKGAALTTYISLAGRYCVLMPNSPRGGGISRKITSATDRRRLKEVTAELDIPDGMGLIVRTAGANRPKPEIKRDCEYLMRLWDDIRELTMKSVAPALIYEEASLIKRSIRDVYSRDIDEILVDGEDGWKAARDFMRMLMPTHVKKVQLWREPTPLFARQQVEAQLDAMVSPTVQLRSGGYLVINQTEALVAIDVNSGRSTRERGIEETALRTNVEAVDEVARQLRLRDLAGLIVIDLIDMESRKNNATVERRLKEALKVDRARIQVGHISHFGLMEMSRQRLRPSLAETSFVTCPHCGGMGHVRGTESAAIHVLRDIEEEGAKRRAAEILVRVASPIAMYILNHKRTRLGEIEARYAMHVTFVGDDSLIPPQIRVERVRAAIEAPVAVTQEFRREAEPQEENPAGVADDAEDDVGVEEDAEGAADGLPAGLPESVAAGANAEGAGGDGANEDSGSAEEAERRRRRRRRRRGGRREESAPGTPELGTGNAPTAAPGTAPGVEHPTGHPTGHLMRPSVPPEATHQAEPVRDAANLQGADLEHIEGVPEHVDTEPNASAADDAARSRRRGRRGGRRRRRDGTEGGPEQVVEPGAEQPELPPIYLGPTPADPFGGHAFDIFDVLERAEQAADRPIPVLSEPRSERATQMPSGWAPQPETDRTPELLSEAATEAQSEIGPGVPAELALAWQAEPVAELQSDSAREPAPEPASASVSTHPAVAPQEATSEVSPEPALAAGGPAILGDYEVAGDATVPAQPVASVPVTEVTSPPVPANDATQEPLIKPIVIGGLEDAPVEKKRGWWRR